jgi:hypothetical protein
MKNLSHLNSLFFALLLANPVCGSAENGKTHSKNILSLQSQIQALSFTLQDGSQAELKNLNRNVNSWYLLDVKSGNLTGLYHFEVAYPEETTVSFHSSGVLIEKKNGSINCPIFQSENPNYLLGLKSKSALFVRLCNSNISLRNISGQNFIDDSLAEEFLSRSVRQGGRIANGPKSAEVRKSAERSQLKSGIAVDSDSELVGRWTPAKYHSGIYVSTIAANQIDERIIKDGLADTLGVEGGSKVTLVAMDLKEFNVGWSHGPLLPGIGHWGKMFPFVKTPSAAGPDSVISFSPLSVTTGVVNPSYLPNLEAVMCGGFQRYHGWMKRPGGPNSGKYYGFIQEGTVLATMSTGLATLIIYNDGNVTLKVWQDEDNRTMGLIRYARQNGVPIVYTEDGKIKPSPYVKSSQRFYGNWSGSAEGKLQTPRSGICLSENNGSQFLIYGFFSTGTPSAMARVFQAYNCKVAMHLDMNNPEWAYFGLLSKVNSQDFIVEHASSSMAPKDKVLSIKGRKIQLPRFVAQPDKANPGDFFYFTRRSM